MAQFELTSTYENIGVIVKGVSAGVENRAELEWRERGSSWKRGMNLVPDWRTRIMDGSSLVDNPWKNQFRGSILKVRPRTEYEVRVNFFDQAGVVSGEPIVGLVTTRDDNFEIGSGVTYHVAPNGNNSNVGDLNHPFLTIRHALDMALPGDTIAIHGGTYHESLSPNNSGMPGEFITITNFGGDDVIIDFGNANNGFSFNGKSYIRVTSGQGEGIFGSLTLQNARGSIFYLTNGSSYNVIEHLLIRDFGYDQPDAGVTMRSESSYNTIQHNFITSSRTGYGDASHREAGVSFAGWPGWSFPGICNVVRYNEIVSVNGGISDGIGGMGNNIAEGGPYKDADIYGNVIKDARGDGIEAEGGGINVRIYENTIDNPENSVLGLATVVVGPLIATRNRGFNLRFSAVKTGYSEVHDGYTYLIHNSFWSDKVGVSPLGSRTPGVFNMGGAGHTRNFISRNNILCGTGSQIHMSSTGAHSSNSFDYDCLWTLGSSIVSWGGRSYPNTPAGLSNFQNAHGQEISGMRADPRLVAPRNGDLRLADGSPCIDAGEIIPGFNDADSPWPYQGGGPDLGAIESGAVGAPNADFTAEPESGEAPLPVQFTDESTGAIDNYLWDFGDGETSTEQNPSHIYNQPGIFEVSLTVTGPGGSDEAFMSIEVTQTFVLTLGATDGGTTDPEPGQYIQTGTVRLTALPDSDYRFFGWSEGGDIISEENPVDIFMDRDREITAIFEYVEPPPGEFVVTITSLGEGYTVPQGEVVVTEGDTLEISATPLAGYKFDHWEGDVSGTNSNISFIVDSNMSVVAVFKEKVITPVFLVTSCAILLSVVTLMKRGGKL